MTSHFFDESKEQSRVKSQIVSNYFFAWAKVIKNTVKKSHYPRIGYVDLFAGPGRYDDGTRSTPLMILEGAIRDKELRRMLVTIFNDKDRSSYESLLSLIEHIPEIETLKYRPAVHNFEVAEEMRQEFERIHWIPSLFFVDPWGYKGLSLALVNALIKDWACECVFFFNYNRINMGLENPAVKEHMDLLFGEEHAEALRQRLEGLSPDDRESEIVEALSQALSKADGERYVLPFRFLDERGTRTSHYLIFVTKHRLGYEIMKGVMAKRGAQWEDGVPRFEYAPAKPQQLILFGFASPLDQLAGMLKEKYAGQALTLKQIYEEHSVGTPFILPNYKKVLSYMWETGEIKANRVGGKPIPPGKFPDDVMVTFPPKE